MNPALLDAPFDHYQRYAAATHLLQSLGLASSRILEVGANRQRLLGQFMPQASLLYTDLHAEGDEKDFVVADATALPFSDREFDAAVSLDVLEHIPAPLRASAIAEMARVAGRAVVVGFPPDRPWVHQAEVDANGHWQALFGEDYPWLQEHKDFGLVDTKEVVATFETSGFHVLRFGQGNAKLWSNLMGAHFIKVKFPELKALVAAADRLYNSRVFAGDHSDHPYREYYVAVRAEEDLARLRADPPFSAQSDEEATSLLAGLATSLRDFALRTQNSEREWKSTAGMLDAYIQDLSVAKREWEATARMLENASKDAETAQLGWRDAVRMVEHTARDLEVAREEWGATAAYAQQLQVAKDESDADWQAREFASRTAFQQMQEEAGKLAEQLAQAGGALESLRQRHLAEQEQHAVEREDLERRLATDAAAYASSRKKWKRALLGLAVLGAAGFSLAGLMLWMGGR